MLNRTITSFSPKHCSQGNYFGSVPRYLPRYCLASGTNEVLKLVIAQSKQAKNGSVETTKRNYKAARAQFLRFVLFLKKSSVILSKITTFKNNHHPSEEKCSSQR